MDREPKQLRIGINPVPGSDDLEFEISYGSRELGSLTLHPDDVSEWIENLHDGFPRVILNPQMQYAAERQKQRDVAEFSASADPDEQDD